MAAMLSTKADYYSHKETFLGFTLIQSEPESATFCLFFWKQNAVTFSPFLHGNYFTQTFNDSDFL